VNAWSSFCPEPPHWRIDWDALDRAFPELRALAGCVQDPRHHGEGDVLTHTRLACEALAALPAFRARHAEEREVLFVAVLLHDVAKPATTRVAPDGAITSPFHGPKGAIQARAALWRMGVPFAAREQILR
jgi:hypothetical protein